MGVARRNLEFLSQVAAHISLEAAHAFLARQQLRSGRIGGIANPCIAHIGLKDPRLQGKASAHERGFCADFECLVLLRPQ